MQLGRLLLLALAFASGASAQSLAPTDWRNVALGRALAATDAITDPYRHAELLASVARAQALSEDASADRTIQQALAAAERISEPAFRAWVLNDIVLAQIAAEDLLGARETAARIDLKRQQAAALTQIATVQLRTGDLAGAQALARMIKERSSQSEILRQIVAVRAARGELGPARALWRDIDDPFYQALAAGDIAIAELRAGHRDRADAAAARVRRADRPQVYGRIAAALADSGELSAALEVLRKIEDPLQRAIFQGRIAAARITTEKEQARDLFAGAIASVESRQDDAGRSVLPLAQLGRLQALSGEGAAAKATLARALEHVDRIQSVERREETLDHIARGQARIGDAHGALATALRMKDRVARALLVRDVAAMQSDASSASASSNAAEFEDPLIETAAQFGVLGVQLLGSKAAAARETIDAACEAVRKIEVVDVKPAAFAALAAARVRTGDTEGGIAIFREALTAADAIASSEQRARALVDVVAALDERLMFLGKPAGGSSSP